MCKEFFSGIKKCKLGSLNSITFLLVRFLSVMIVITLESINYYAKLTFFIFFHILFTLFLYVFRPYESVKDNIIESIHQINFTIAAVLLFFLKTKNDWNESYEDNYILMLFSGPILCCVISLIFIFIQIISEIKGNQKGSSKTGVKTKMKILKPTNIRFEESKNKTSSIVQRSWLEVISPTFLNFLQK